MPVATRKINIPVGPVREMMIRLSSASEAACMPRVPMRAMALREVWINEGVKSSAVAHPIAAPEMAAYCSGHEPGATVPQSNSAAPPLTICMPGIQKSRKAPVKYVQRIDPCEITPVPRHPCSAESVLKILLIPPLTAGNSDAVDPANSPFNTPRPSSLLLGKFPL